MFDNLLKAHDAFREYGVGDPMLETLRLVDLLSKGALRKADSLLLEHAKIDLADLAQKRNEGVPLEYIVGEATFMGKMFSCTPDTLIPEEDTALLVTVALDFISNRPECGNALTVIDMGTGCGNIAVSLAMNCDNLTVLASDIDAETVKVARDNVNRFNLQDRVSLFCGDLFSPFKGAQYEGQIDMVVCNPPYIPTGSLRKLPPEVFNHEPRIALDAGPYGIDFYRRLISGALVVLRPRGKLMFEIGVGQDKLVTRLLTRNDGYEDIDCFRSGSEVRVLSATKKP